MRADRRTAGTLDEKALDLLGRRSEPLSAPMLARLLRAEGVRIYESQAFRLLRALWRKRRIRRVELLNAYVAGGADRQISLVCRRCRGFRAVEDQALFVALDRLAREHRFSVARYIIEVSCDCVQCRCDSPASRRAGDRVAGVEEGENA